MASINKPPILDETGQAILSELERLTAIAGPPGEDYILTSADKAEIAGMVEAPVQDVQVNGTSVLENGVANISEAVNGGDYGVVKIMSSNGIGRASNGYLYIVTSTDAQVKSGTNTTRPISPSNQHLSTFYGLAKAAGDATQASSSNAVGVYTEAAQSAIHDMLNAPVAVSGSTPSITAKSGIRYVCGEVSTISITPCASGTCEIQFTSGTSAAILSVSGVTWPEWFDPTALETSRIYDLLITDGTLGMVMSWAT